MFSLSVAAILLMTCASLGTSVLDWLILDRNLSLGQWFDAISVAIFVLLYKIAPYEQQQFRRFELLKFDDEDDSILAND